MCKDRSVRIFLRNNQNKYRSLFLLSLPILAHDTPVKGCQKDISSLSPDYIDGLVQDCSSSTANALELLQSCTKPSIFTCSHIHTGSRLLMLLVVIAYHLDEYLKLIADVDTKLHATEQNKSDHAEKL